MRRKTIAVTDATGAGKWRLFGIEVFIAACDHGRLAMSAVDIIPLIPEVYVAPELPVLHQIMRSTLRCAANVNFDETPGYNGRSWPKLIHIDRIMSLLFHGNKLCDIYVFPP